MMMMKKNIVHDYYHHLAIMLQVHLPTTLTSATSPVWGFHKARLAKSTGGVCPKDWIISPIFKHYLPTFVNFMENVSKHTIYINQ